jgi:hypothetical protein
VNLAVTGHDGVQRVLDWVPSPSYARGTVEQYELPRMRLAKFGAPVTASLAQYQPEILDQGKQGSCTGHGVAEALWIALIRWARAHGLVDPDCPSPAWPYLLGRCIEGTETEDTGCVIADVIAGVQQYGFVPRSVLPYHDTELTPPDALFENLKRIAYDQRVVRGFARITSRGAQKLSDVKSAIASGYAVVFGTDVDQAFMDLPAGAIWQGPVGRSLGGHCMILSGYYESSLTITNSWGTGWSSGGRCQVANSTVDAFDDLWIVEAAPQYSGTV